MMSHVTFHDDSITGNEDIDIRTSTENDYSVFYKPEIITDRVARFFFTAYGQNFVKKWQKCSFLKKLQPKQQNLLTTVISIFIGVLNCSESSTLYFLPEESFYPITEFLL